MPEPLRVVAMASGGGSDFQSLVDRFAGEEAPARVAGLIASRDTAGALDRAARHGVPSAVLPQDARGEAEADFLLDRIEAWDAGLVVLAGYLRLVPARVVRALRGRIINIHPALLPAFGGEGMYGLRVHRAVVEAGVRVTGPTVHFVDEAYDRGPIIAQWPVPVLASDTPEAVAARVLEVEHRLLPDIVEALAVGRVRLGGDGRVEWTEEWFGAEGFESAGPGGSSSTGF